MTFVSAISPDGQRYKIFENGTWERDGSIVSGKAAFRSSCWGDSIEDVKTVEKAELILEKPDFLAYKSTVAGLSTLALYHFIDRRLVMGRYAIDEPHANQSAYLHDFDNLKELLKKKYGISTASNVFWKNDLYRGDYSQWGMAVSCDHVSFFEVWDDEETHLELQLYGDNYTIKLGMLYQSIALKHLMDAKTELGDMDGL